MTNSWNRTQIAVNFQAFCLKSHNLCCWYYAFAHLLCNACDRGCGHCNNVCWKFHPLTQNASSKAYQVVRHVMILVSTSVSVSNSEAFSVNPYRAEINTALFVGGACYQQLVIVLFTSMTCLCGDSNVHPWYLERLVYTIGEAIWLICERWKQNQNCEAIEVFVSESQAANSAEELPERLKTWAFGECVRMLHVGPDPLTQTNKVWRCIWKNGLEHNIPTKDALQ